MFSLLGNSSAAAQAASPAAQTVTSGFVSRTNSFTQLHMLHFSSNMLLLQQHIQLQLASSQMPKFCIIERAGTVRAASPTIASILRKIGFRSHLISFDELDFPHWKDTSMASQFRKFSINL
jgi:hypothetical protein